MEILSPYIIAILLGWLTAQSAKYALVATKKRSFDHVRQLYSSGNMPSSHSAVVVALSMTIGLIDGFGTAVFGLAALFAAIVMYDSVMVRRSSGEQGEAIQRLIKEQKSKVPLPRAAKGHTPQEVAAGAILGAFIGIIVFLATK